MLKKIVAGLLIVVLSASVYPIYMGMIMLTAYFKNGGIDAADYPKYIIPYTPMCVAIIICVVILPIVYKLKKYALTVLSLVGIGLFLLIEKITVGEAQIIDGVKHMEITIYYRFVGAVSL